MRKIVGIGETVLDIIFKDDRPTAAIPGESTFNAMISLGRMTSKHFLETKVMMVTQTGSDHVGDIVISFMEDNGVNSLAVTRNAGALLFYDINFRESHLRDLPDTFEHIQENCRLSDVVRGSSKDFGYLFGTTDPVEIYDKLISPLCRNFICTQGAGPVEVFTTDKHMSFPVEDYETVSTIGAGLFSKNCCQSIDNYISRDFEIHPGGKIS